MHWHSRLTTVLLVLFVPILTHADEASDLRDLLGREIIGKALALQEVQEFCKPRVPRMPQVESVQDWERHAERIRRDVLRNVVFRGEAAKWRDAKCDVKWLGQIDGGPGYVIKKLRYEALPGLWIPALLYEPTKLSGKVPVVMNVNGHDGKGKVAKYKQTRCINQAKRGMIAMNVEWLGMGQLRTDNFRHYRMNQLDLCGTSGLAPFYLSMKRGLDVLLSHKHADPKRVGVAGLSGGGWQTIVISSLDTRVTLANPVAGYSSFRTRTGYFSDLGDSEQTPVDLATVADYAHLTALMAPRGLLLTYNIRDNCCFASGHALPPLLDAAGPIYKLYDRSDRLRSHVNHDPGTHNFERDNREALYRMMADVFYDASTSFPRREIQSDKEIKTAQQLDVDLPKHNADFHTLALDVMKDLPRGAKWPRTEDAAEKWRAERRKDLARIVRATQYTVTAKQTGSAKKGDITATLWRLRMGDTWTVPAVELVRGAPKETAIVINEAGRKNTVDTVQKLLKDDKRVLAVDPFYFGESKIAQRDFLFALLISAVGDRPLGIQASQLAATARWLHTQRKLDGVSIVTSGPRSSLIGLVATALEPTAIESAELYGSLGSLKEIVEQNESVDKKPELFCFGLLERFDIKQLWAITYPKQPVTLPDPSDRVVREFSDIGRWTKLFKGTPGKP